MRDQEEPPRPGPTPESAADRPRPDAIAPAVLGLGGLAALVAATTWAVASVSAWLVPPYWGLMAWLVHEPIRPWLDALRTRGKSRVAGSGPRTRLRRAGSASGVPATAAGASPRGAADATPAPRERRATGSEAVPAGEVPAPASAVGSATAEAPTAGDPPRRGRGKGRGRSRPVPPAAPEPAEVLWVRTGPGQFVRLERPAAEPSGPPDVPAPEAEAPPVQSPDAPEDASLSEREGVVLAVPAPATGEPMAAGGLDGGSPGDPPAGTPTDLLPPCAGPLAAPGPSGDPFAPWTEVVSAPPGAPADPGLEPVAPVGDAPPPPPQEATGPAPAAAIEPGSPATARDEVEGGTGVEGPASVVEWTEGPGSDPGASIGFVEPATAAVEVSGGSDIPQAGRAVEPSGAPEGSGPPGAPSVGRAPEFDGESPNRPDAPDPTASEPAPRPRPLTAPRGPAPRRLPVWPRPASRARLRPRRRTDRQSCRITPRAGSRRLAAARSGARGLRSIVRHAPRSPPELRRA